MLKKRDVTKQLDNIEHDLKIVHIKMIHLEKMVLHLKNLTDKLSGQLDSLSCKDKEKTNFD